MISVVIIPPSGLNPTYEDNRIWARQYVGVDPENRKIVELANSTPRAVVSATRSATLLAGEEGQIIYAVGHGGAAEGQAGQVDLAPQRRFRISQFLAFYNDRTNAWEGEAVTTMERVLVAASGQRGSVRRRQRRAWCDSYIATGCAQAQRQILELQDLLPYYEELGLIFRTNRVRKIILLTCNVGNAMEFLDELATDLGVRVVAYTERVISHRVRRRRQVTVYMYLEGDSPGQGSNTERSATELLPNVPGSKIRYGRVRRERGRLHRHTTIAPAI